MTILTRNLEVVWVVVRKDFNNEFNIHMHLFLTQISLVLGSDDALVPLTLVLSLLLLKIWWRETRLWISIEGSSEKQDEWFWFVNLVVDPSARLGDTKASPLVL